MELVLLIWMAGLHIDCSLQYTFKALQRVQTQNVKEKTMYYSACFTLFIFFILNKFVDSVQEAGVFAGEF